ncbi:MAG: cytidine deaminase [Fimbriimonadaceae bacterium]|jgi:cytidine deaminase|nr:cytidine deaminase [Fimbriimonadaceae bacterium]
MSVQDLLAAASRAQENAYAPYSSYRVGAAVRDENGRIWAACNVENVSFGLSVCAERNAVAAMVAGGGKEVRDILLLTVDGAKPCGACLQVLREFSHDPKGLSIHLATNQSGVQTVTLNDLLPFGFASSNVKSNAT